MWSGDAGAAIKPTSLAELHEVFLKSKKYDELSKSLSEHYAIGGIKTDAGIDREIAFADKM